MVPIHNAPVKVIHVYVNTLRRWYSRYLLATEVTGFTPDPSFAAHRSCAYREPIQS